MSKYFKSLLYFHSLALHSRRISVFFGMDALCFGLALIPSANIYSANGSKSKFIDESNKEFNLEFLMP